MSEIIMRRHAQTQGNLNQCYNGSIDEPLCAEGIACAKGFEPDLKLKKIYVSPMKRTRETAKILYPNAEHILCNGLREMNFGNFEGRNYNDMARDAEYQAWLDSNCEAQCPNGEKMSDFVVRCAKSFSKIVQFGSEKIGEKRVFLIHGGVIMALFSVFYVPKTDYFDFETPNCCGFRAELNDDLLEKTGKIELTNCIKIGNGEMPIWR